MTALEATPHNLPVPTSSLVGRDRELESLSRMLVERGVRLVTLVGTGGTGKTRLALQVAEQVLHAFPDGVFLVELAQIREAERVLPEVARALGLRESGAEALDDALGAFLQAKRLLLVLDNLEQIPGVAEPIATLVSRCPDVHILATSRGALGLTAETVVAVEPLEPAAARELFGQRASAARSDLRLDNGNANAVSEICARLDGLPLAIELAAARVRLLPPKALLAQLARGFDILKSSAPDRPDRHRTLESAIAWSVDLLGPEERRMFARLACFAGSWSLEAAEVVCACTLDHLEVLVDHALVVPRTTADGDARFVMLETIHAYARRLLDSNDDADLMRERHADYYQVWSAQAELGLSGSEQSTWLARLDLELDNLRVALRCLVDHPARAGAFLRMNAAIWRYWYLRGLIGEGESWLQQALEPAAESPGDSELALPRAKVMHGAANLALLRGNYAAARRWYEESLTIRRAHGDTRGAAATLNNLAQLVMREGDLATAKELLGEAIELLTQVGDVYGAAVARGGLGAVLLDSGDAVGAMQWFVDAEAAFRQLGDRWGSTWVKAHIAETLRSSGSLPQAERAFQEVLRTASEIEALDMIAGCLEGLASVHAARGRARRAAWLFGAAAAVRERSGVALSPANERDMAQHIERATLALGPAAFHSARLEGLSAPLDEAVRVAVSTSEVVETYKNPLTTREREVAALIARGLTNRQIGERLVITEGTAGLHVVHILNKLGFQSRSQVAAWAAEQGLAATLDPG